MAIMLAMKDKKMTRLRKVWDEKEEWRNERGLNQAEATEMLGLQSPSSMTQYLEGSLKLSIEKGVQLANMLEVDLVEIWEDQDLQIPGFYRLEDMGPAEISKAIRENFSVEEARRFHAEGILREGDPE